MDSLLTVKVAEVVAVATDKWIFWATILAGFFTALATLGAVIYTNKKTAERYEKDKILQNKADKMIVIQPQLLFKTFGGILDMLIMNNLWHRVLLLSGDDGFDFFDNIDKRYEQKCPILMISNNSCCQRDIRLIKISTETKMKTDSDEIIPYSTTNFVKLLRSREEIAIRLQNQVQFEKTIELYKKKAFSDVTFVCKVDYFTLANQQICYEYAVNIRNGSRVEIIKDEYTVVDHVTLSEDIMQASVFRNLQDEISHIDRSAYVGRKTGEAQMQGIMKIALQSKDMDSLEQQSVQEIKEPERAES